jgi:phosphonate transport system permease protein
MTLKPRTLLLLWLALLIASWLSLTGDWTGFYSLETAQKMAQFCVGFFPPNIEPKFLAKVGIATLETLAISWLGTLIAAILGFALALPAAGFWGEAAKPISRFVLNVLRAIPELVWAGLFVIAAGLGPFPGMLALAMHTAGVLGRLYAESLENTPQSNYQQLRHSGVGPVAAMSYTSLPQIWPQLASYFLYRWENNIRAAAVLGVVGAGGLGQLLYLSLSLFKFDDAATVLIAMLILVWLVDSASNYLRQKLA